jgi:hypothetical protein
VSADEAVVVVGSEIRDFAAVRASGKYRQTLTEFWVRLVAHTRKHGEMDFHEHPARFPILMNASS